MKKIILFSLLGLILFSGCSNQFSVEALKDYESQCRDLNDDALIIEFYQVDIKLREAIDNLFVSSIESVQPRKGEAALGYGLGSLILNLSQKSPKQIVEGLRKKKAILLMIIYERGLEMPISVE